MRSSKFEPEPRLLTQQQAAAYCGIGVKAFKDICPIRPTSLNDRLQRYDRYRLDAWLDSLAGGVPAKAPAEWLHELEASLSNAR